MHLRVPTDGVVNNAHIYAVVKLLGYWYMKCSARNMEALGPNNSIGRIVKKMMLKRNHWLAYSLVANDCVSSLILIV